MDKIEDWTLAGMLTRKRAANGGKPLSAAQEAEVKALHDELSELQKKLETLTEIRSWVEQAEKYSWGEGVPQDYDEAVKWYRKAAVHGDATAQYNLGFFYDQGKGVSQDYAEAVEWYRKAAEQGYAAAQNNLGVCYYAGKGVPQDYDEAVKWYRKAAEQGHAVAQFSLGYYCYELGNGVPQDHAEAHKWYRKAASQGHVESQFHLDREHYQNIVFAFIDLIATHRPLIGDCSTLPHPKKTILYAIKWVIDYYESMQEAPTNQDLCERSDRLISTHNRLFTELARDWHDIDPEDKDAIAELGKYDSFPDWALPLKMKYINEEAAAKEACDAAIQVMVDAVDRENKKGRANDTSTEPSDPEYGSKNTLVTREQHEAAKKWLHEQGFLGNRGKLW